MNLFSLSISYNFLGITCTYNNIVACPQSGVLLVNVKAFEEMRTPYASGQEISEMKFGNAPYQKQLAPFKKALSPLG